MGGKKDRKRGGQRRLQGRGEGTPFRSPPLKSMPLYCGRRSGGAFQLPQRLLPEVSCLNPGGVKEFVCVYLPSLSYKSESYLHFLGG